MKMSLPATRAHGVPRVCHQQKEEMGIKLQHEKLEWEWKENGLEVSRRKGRKKDSFVFKDIDAHKHRMFEPGSGWTLGSRWGGLEASFHVSGIKVEKEGQQNYPDGLYLLKGCLDELKTWPLHFWEYLLFKKLFHDPISEFAWKL